MKEKIKKMQAVVSDLMQQKVKSMQEYRVRFERTYGANLDTRDLFERYGL